MTLEILLKLKGGKWLLIDVNIIFVSLGIRHKFEWCLREKEGKKKISALCRVLCSDRRKTEVKPKIVNASR